MGRARAFARRRSRLLSLVEHARRGDGAGTIADPGDRRSQRQEARRCRRPARQELAPAASAGAPQRSRSQETGDCYLRRAAAAVGEGVARRDRGHVDVLEFLRRSRKQGIHTRDRHGSPRESARSEGAGRARRLHLRPRVGRAQRLAPRIRVTDLDALAIYRQRYGEGIVRRSLAEEVADARALYLVLAEIGGAELVGPARELAAGTFYRPAGGE